MSERFRRWGGAVWLAACLLGSSTWCVTAARELGVTFDEPVYVAAGLDRWRHGGVGGLMRLGVMPLPVDVVTLPVWVYERLRPEPLRLRTDDRGHVVDDADLLQVLPMARAATLMFWWGLLIAGWMLARRLGGDTAGAIAAGFLAFEPSLLAHATLATTDIAVTACLLAFAVVWTSDATADSRSARPWLLPGVWFGLALLSKASALTFAPLIMLAGAMCRGRDIAWRDAFMRAAKTTAVGLLIAVLYCGSDWRREDSFVAWAQSLPSGPGTSALRAVSEHLTIFSNAGEGIAQQIKHNIRGHDTFVLGRAYARAAWFYFPVVLSIKVSAGLLLAVAAACVLRRREAANTPLIAAMLILLCSPAFRVQTGVRMVLPILALAIVGSSAALSSATSTRVRRAGSGLAVLLLAWSATAALRAWPDGLRFANELWGGTDTAYRLVSDSNYDWGQGLPDLAAHLDSPRPVDVWYWGTDPGARVTRWRLLDVRAIGDAGEPSIRRVLEGRTLAVSTTLLYGSVLAEGTRVSDEDRGAMQVAESLRRLLNAVPWRSRTRTFLIYDFTSAGGVVESGPSPR